MIQAEVRTGPQGLAVLRVLGHAPEKSHAAICNAVSILTQTLVQSLKILVGESAYLLEEKKGWCHIQKVSSETGNPEVETVLLKSWLIGMELIRNQSEGHLQIHVENCSS